MVTDAGTGGRIESNGVFDIDAVSNITLDADGGNIYLKDNGTSMASFTTSNATFAGDITLANNKDIHLLKADGTNDGTMITRATGNAVRFKYASNALIFDSVDDREFRVYNSAGDNIFQVNPNSTAASSTVDIVNGKLRMGSTLVIDASRNITAGTISSGNITTTGYLRGPSTFTIDPATHGDDTGTLVIAGNLQVDGTTTTINSTTLTVDDKLVTLASGSANAAAANGAGIEVDISGATNPSLTYDGTNDEWDFNKDINVTGTIKATSTGAAHLILNGDTNNVDDTGQVDAIIDLLQDGNPGQYGYRINTENHSGQSALHFQENIGGVYTSRLKIENNGNVGIGTTAPDAKLRIDQDAGVVGLKVTGGSGGTNIAEFRRDVGATTTVGINGSGAEPQMYFTSTANTFAMGVNGSNFEIADNTTIGTNSRLTIDTSGNVGIGTTTPDTKLDITTSGVEGLILNQDTTTAATSSRLFFKDSTRINGMLNVSGILEFRTDMGVGSTSGTKRFSISPTLVKSEVPLRVEEYQIDTTVTSTTATTQVAIHSFAAATFRSARFTVQITNSTDSTYHLTEILMIHDGTTPSITEYGTIFTGSAEATFDADISSGNVRLLATPATTDSMAFKVVAHTITT